MQEGQRRQADGAGVSHLTRCQRNRRTQRTDHIVRAWEITLVYHKDIGNLHETRLQRLNVISKPGASTTTTV